MINYTKFRSDLYSYTYCMNFLKKESRLSIARRPDLVTQTSYPWTELQSDKERFMTSPSELDDDDEKVLFFRRKLQTLYKLELARTFPGVRAIRAFWELLDQLWHQPEHDFSSTQSRLVTFWREQGMELNRHDMGMLSLSSKLLNLFQPERFPIWDTRRDNAFFQVRECELGHHPVSCYQKLCDLVSGIRRRGHVRLYRDFMNHLVEFHTAALPPLSPLPFQLVLHILTKRRDTMEILTMNRSLSVQWSVVSRYLQTDLERVGA